METPPEDHDGTADAIFMSFIPFGGYVNFALFFFLTFVPFSLGPNS